MFMRERGRRAQMRCLRGLRRARTKPACRQDMATKAAPWKRPAPKRKRTKHLTETQKDEAKRRASKAGRHYPNLVDNMAVASKSKRGGTKRKAAKQTASRKSSSA